MALSRIMMRRVSIEAFLLCTCSYLAWRVFPPVPFTPSARNSLSSIMSRSALIFASLIALSVSFFFLIVWVSRSEPRGPS